MSQKKQSLLFQKYVPFLFLFFSGLFFWSGYTLIGPFIGSDVYYHFTHAQLIREAGSWSYLAPWLPYHFLGNMPANPYLLHHSLVAILIPLFDDPLIALHLVAAMLSAGVFTLYYAILRKSKIAYAGLFTAFFLIGSPTFLFRLLLDRPFTIGILASMLGIYYLIRKKHLLLFLLTTVGILAYNLVILLIPMTLVYLFVEYRVYQKIHTLKPLIATLSGVATGLLIHPHTIAYTHLIFVHAFEILALPFLEVQLPVGDEIIHTGIITTLLDNMLPILIFLVSMATLYFFYTEKKLNRKEKHIYFFLTLLTIGWFPILLYVTRGVEYWYPAAMLTVAFLFEKARKTHFFSTLTLPNWISLAEKPWEQISFGILLFASISGMTILRLTQAIPPRELRTERIEAIEDISNVLTKEPSTVLWYPDWGMFTELFYVIGEKHQYVAGFDPTFFYNYDHTLYQMWYDLSTTGEYCFDTACNYPQSLSYMLPHYFDSHILIFPKNKQFDALHAAIEQEELIILTETEQMIVYSVE